MRAIFDNGATRARAGAWAGWCVFAGLVAWVALLADPVTARERVTLLAVFGVGSGLILVRPWPRKIPVLNYHSVSADPSWLQIADQVSLTPGAFERQLEYLARHGYQTLFMSEIQGLLAGGRDTEPPAKYVALTFDDGYADNWIAVLPLLKKYGMKATLFVSTGFITGADGCRPTLDNAAPGAIDWSGYLTWPELRSMQASGLVEIQSHGCSHSRVFTGPQLRGFVGPGKPNLWMLWNARPETRAGWWRELASDSSLWGHPVFPQGAALAFPEYSPDPEAVSHLQLWAGGAGGAVFTKPDWQRRLRDEWRHCEGLSGDRDRMELAGEYALRVERELGESRQTLEKELGRKVELLCWPENRFSEAGEQIARKVGYIATVSNRHHSRNVAGEAPGAIVRVFIGSRAAGIRSPFLDAAAFILELKVFEGWYVAYPILAVMHLARKFMFAARRMCPCRRDYLSIWA